MVENVPPVLVDHNHAVAIVEIPVRVTSALLPQTGVVVPASTVGASVKVIVTLSVNGLQSPTPVVVKVSIMLPFAVSADVGVYCAFKRLTLLNVPAPEELHEPVFVVPPQTFPAN